MKLRTFENGYSAFVSTQKDSEAMYKLNKDFFFNVFLYTRPLIFKKIQCQWRDLKQKDNKIT